MSHIYHKLPNTRLLIIQRAAHLFITEGYSRTSISRIARDLDISLGNITFYFPTKEHLLSVLVDELIDFQKLIMEKAAADGKSSLLAYCLELTAMASICEESDTARDFYASSYASPMTLALIRENDSEKTREIFSDYLPEWADTEWRATENIVSGIEYATIMTREEDTPLSLQIEKTLDTILYLYGVPSDLRKLKIEKVLAMDYRALGRRILGEFREYIEKVNEQNLKREARRKRRSNKPKNA